MKVNDQKIDDMVKVKDHIRQNYSKMKLLLPAPPSSDVAAYQTNTMDESKLLTV
jgi:hypothetical protein